MFGYCPQHRPSDGLKNLVVTTSSAGLTSLGEAAEPGDGTIDTRDIIVFLNAWAGA